LIQDHIGQNAIQSSKSEIRAHVALVGLLQQSKLLVIEFVSPVDKSFKQEFQLRICLRAVDSLVVKDVVEAIPIPLGLITKIKG
jgi:hypothetical protein